MTKKIVSIFLAMLMLCGAFTVGAAAEETDENTDHFLYAYIMELTYYVGDMKFIKKMPDFDDYEENTVEILLPSDAEGKEISVSGKFTSFFLDDYCFSETKLLNGTVSFVYELPYIYFHNQNNPLVMSEPKYYTITFTVSDTASYDMATYAPSSDIFDYIYISDYTTSEYCYLSAEQLHELYANGELYIEDSRFSKIENCTIIVKGMGDIYIGGSDNGIGCFEMSAYAENDAKTGDYKLYINYSKSDYPLSERVLTKLAAFRENVLLRIVSFVFRVLRMFGYDYPELY